jgi:CheY-like chemotaxis protein
MASCAPILLAEDEESDVFLFGRALKKAGITAPLVAVPNGRDAIRYLLGDPPFEDRAQHPLPALLVLDLKMPIVDGFDVLVWLRTRPELHALPVVILTSSNHREDQAKARELGAVDYIVKPSEPARLCAIVQDLYTRWVAPDTDPVAGGSAI